MKKVLISIATLIFIMSMITVVNAASSGNITLTSSRSTVKAGDEFSITVIAQDANGYNGIQFRDITVTNENGATTPYIEFKEATALENNSKFSGVGEETGITGFTYSLSDVNTSEIQVCQLTFEVKEGIEAGTYNINVGEMKVFSLNDTDDTTEIGTKTISINAIVDTTIIGNNDNNTVDTNNSSNGSNSNKNSNTSSNHSTSNTSSNSSNKTTKLPQTGAEVTSVIAIAILSIFAVISYVSYKKYKNI